MQTIATTKAALRPDRIDTDLLELGDRRVHHPQRLAVSRHGAVATAHYHATEAGVEMLRGGGNLGCVQLVMRDRNEFIGVADPRRDGSAGGP